MKILLRDIAHARSGDKGSTCNIGLIAYSLKGYRQICKSVTRESVHAYFSPLGVTLTERYELPNLWALNFLLHGALDGGASLSLRTDSQGKALGQALLEMCIDVDDDFSGA